LSTDHMEVFICLRWYCSNDDLLDPDTMKENKFVPLLWINMLTWSSWCWNLVQAVDEVIRRRKLSAFCYNHLFPADHLSIYLDRGIARAGW